MVQPAAKVGRKGIGGRDTTASNTPGRRAGGRRGNQNNMPPEGAGVQMNKILMAMLEELAGEAGEMECFLSSFVADMEGGGELAEILGRVLADLERGRKLVSRASDKDDEIDRFRRGITPGKTARRAVKAAGKG